MFSHLSSFLPAALNPNAHNTKESSTDPPGQPDDAEQQKETSADEPGAKKSHRHRAINETFIVVRPPPSKSNHPLNLQLQLVPPSSRDRSSHRRSVDLTDAPELDANASANETPVLGPDLTRTSSTRSNRSDASMYSNSASSVTSVSSFASGSSTSSGRRMIIPLYNLSAHNVMTNTILDAGTDAKVAKFNKRGMEVVGLATLEPVEVFGGSGTTIVTTDDVRRITGKDKDGGSPTRGIDSPDSSLSPISSAVSISSASDTHSEATPSTLPTPYPTSSTLQVPAQGGGARKLFGKMFKKKEVRHAQSSSISSIHDVQPAAVAEALPKAVSKSSHAPEPVLQPAVLGVQPMLSCVIYPPTGRPTAYVWIIRKWLKGSGEGLFGGVRDMLTVDRHHLKEAGSLVEVRFEWSRGKTSSHRRDGTAETEKHPPSRRNSTALTSTDAPSETSLPKQTHTASAPGSLSKKNKRLSVHDDVPRPSIDSEHSRFPQLQIAGAENDSHSDIAGSHDHNAAEPDEDDQSDPEDSETPWTCALTMKRLAGEHQNRAMSVSLHSHGHSRSHSHSTAAPSYASGTVDDHSISDAAPIRVKLATLSPAPHHPKVVVQLKVPYPLPDLEVDFMRVRKRVVTPSGVARPATAAGGTSRSTSGEGKAPEGLVLTAEELKDVISSTAFWLIVREGLGGVGRVTRKGDGWRIRA